MSDVRPVPLQKLGKYEILAELGHGAMGVVYKARDPFIGRLVALKTINSNLVDRPDLLERFYQEAQSAGKLQHPNIVTIFELGQEKNTPFIAMQYLDGESLEKTIVQQTDLPIAVKVGYIVRICQALEYAHKNRVVHRDIKPGNIMVNSEGVVTVVDFGIARLVDFSRTHTNMMIGTPAYMAPELFRKEKANERTDIWAVGVTFYELICYQRPFTGDGYDIITSIREDDFPVPSSVVPDCPVEVEAVIQRMLCKKPVERYQSMEDVLLDLEPVWNRLRSDAAAELVRRGKEFYELGDLSKAQETLRHARQIDNSNTGAKSLFEKVAAELRRSEVLPRVQEHLSRGRVFLQSGQLQEAKSEAEAALVLDSRHESAQHLIAEVEAATARAQQLEQKLRLTKQRLAEGALPEAESALRQALELDAGNQGALELKRQLADEQYRREKRKRLNELLQRARTLWTELNYDECLALLAEGLRDFPNETELKKLQETARADQLEHQKQWQISEVRKLLGQQKFAEARNSLDLLAEQHAQDITIRNLQALLLREEEEQKRKQRLEQDLASLRNLVTADKLQQALVRGEQLLREFPQEFELKDLVGYVRDELRQQQEKRNEEERARQIRALIAADRFVEAGEAARRAVQEFPKQDVFRKFALEADEKRKDQELRERMQREIQQRVQEIRTKINRQELSDAIELAQRTLATLGHDTDVTQLLQAAQVESEERNKNREQQKRQLEAARTLVEKGDCAGATQLIDLAIATRILAQSDPQAMQLLSQIAEKEEALQQEELKRRKEAALQQEELKRRKEEERLRQQKKKAEDEKRLEEVQKAVREAKKPPSAPAIKEKPSSRPASVAAVVPHPSPPPQAPVGSPSLIQAATNIAGTTPKPKTSVPVMTPLPVVPPQRTIIDAQVRMAEPIARPPTLVTPPRPRLFGKRAVLALVGLFLVGGVSGGIYILFHPSGPVVDKQRELELQKESQDLRKQGRLEEATTKDQEIASLKGTLAPWAQLDAETLEKLAQQENSLMAEAKIPDDKNEYQRAEHLYQQVIDLNGAREAEARAARDSVILREKGGSLETIAQGFFDHGTEAFKRRDYPAAERFFRDAFKQGPPNWGLRERAQSYVKSCENRLNQQSSLREAQNQFGAKQYDPARNSASKAANAQDGDPEFQRQARALLQQIQAREDQQSAFDEGTRLEKAGQRGPAKAQFERARAISNGDPDMIARATKGIERIDGYRPPPPPPAKNYDAPMKEAESAIGQGRWDNADSILNGVPTTQMGYTDLKRKIAEGRQEDQDFSARKSAVGKAVLDKNENTLKDLRSFFSPIANQGGRHSADANDIVVRVDRTLKEIEIASVSGGGSGNSGRGGGPIGNDSAQILAVLNQFAEAFTKGDIEQIKAVRNLTPSDERKMRQTFKDMSGHGVPTTINNCQPAHISGDSATVKCAVVSGPNRPQPATFSLNRINGQWRIGSTN